MKLLLRSAIWPLLAALLWSGCSRQPISSATSQQTNRQAGDQGSLPFHQHKQEDGISPSSAMIPAPVEVPMGTPLTVRLKSSISSASAHVGDSFEAELDEPVVVQGKAIFRAGTPVEGTVIALKRFAAGVTPAYLRLQAASIRWQGKMIAIESSSISAKAGVPRVQQQKSEGAPGSGFSPEAAASDMPKTVRFSAGRRLTFRLIAPAMLPH